MIILVKFFVFILAWSPANSIPKISFHFLQKTASGKNEMLLIITRKIEGEMIPECEVITNETLINETLTSNDSLIHTIPEEEMHVLRAHSCYEFKHQSKRDIRDLPIPRNSLDNTEYDYYESSSTSRTGSRNGVSIIKKQESKSSKSITTRTSPSKTISFTEAPDEHDKWKRETESTTQPSKVFGTDGLLIYPGTKWCGSGNISKNYDDLGYYKDTDQCCRAHDHCDDFIAAGETKYNLTNDSPFTKLHCQCDEAFFKCLENVHSITANTVGTLYFNILRRECYVLDHPPGKCKKYRTIFKLSCLQYEKDTSKKKVYQWVQPKRYTKVSIKVR